MKQFFLLSAFILTLGSGSFGQVNGSGKPGQKPEDQIKQYWFVMLTEEANRTQDSVTAALIQAGHMANINRLYYEGKLKVAGPFGDDKKWKGIFIFDPMATVCNTKEELEKILNTDPAVASGRLAYQIHPWWTAATGSFTPGKPDKKF